MAKVFQFDFEGGSNGVSLTSGNGLFQPIEPKFSKYEPSKPFWPRYAIETISVYDDHLHHARVFKVRYRDLGELPEIKPLWKQDFDGPPTPTQFPIPKIEHLQIMYTHEVLAHIAQGMLEQHLIHQLSAGRDDPKMFEAALIAFFKQNSGILHQPIFKYDYDEGGWWFGGPDITPGSGKNEAVDKLPALDYMVDHPGGSCSLGEGNKKMALRWMVIHMNDSHQWTREQIADWLDEISDPTGENGPDIRFQGEEIDEDN